MSLPDPIGLVVRLVTVTQRRFASRPYSLSASQQSGWRSFEIIADAELPTSRRTCVAGGIAASPGRYACRPRARNAASGGAYKGALVVPRNTSLNWHHSSALVNSALDHCRDSGWTLRWYGLFLKYSRKRVRISLLLITGYQSIRIRPGPSPAPCLNVLLHRSCGGATAARPAGPHATASAENPPAPTKSGLLRRALPVSRANTNFFFHTARAALDFRCLQPGLRCGQSSPERPFRAVRGLCGRRRTGVCARSSTARRARLRQPSAIFQIVEQESSSSDFPRKAAA